MKVHSLPIQISDLLDRRIVESERLELKAGWNPAAIMRSVRAFANDFQNLGGGYPGPDASIGNDALNKKRIVARRYRNRRIGEFLKELGLTEGRATGIPKIYDALEQNGSPRPHIETDKGRTYFLIELPSHPAFRAKDEIPVKAPVKAPVVESILLNNTERKILALCETRAIGRKELLARLGYSSFVGSVKLALQRLRDIHLRELTIPEKPNSRNQQYRITDEGRQLLRAPR
jgi:ATP-dependent DNA helicase RecG